MKKPVISVILLLTAAIQVQAETWVAWKKEFALDVRGGRQWQPELDRAAPTSTTDTANTLRGGTVAQLAQGEGSEVPRGRARLGASGQNVVP